ncbi:hypothetical protein [Sphingobacterium siyangense]|uniref:hypothetical protein n=1 Tax=Sphingobacterium siyangense TaxID=459529 RepID=UPI002FDE41F6
MKSLQTVKTKISQLGLQIRSGLQSLGILLFGQFVLRFRYSAILWFSTLRYAPICLSLALKRVASKMLYPRKFALFPS